MSVKKTEIDFTSTGQFSKLFLNYVNGENAVKSFYSYSPKLDSFKQVIADKLKEVIDRDVLVNVLKKQYSYCQLPTANCELLLDKNTFTVCTGHQLCLFTGPLYFIYKIISTINLAEALKKQYPENKFIPVYWMATEDHDFEEISSINLFGKNVKWNNPEAKGAVGRLNTASLVPVIDELKTIMGDSVHANELIELFNNAYVKHSNLADATRYLVHHLFGKYGLVMVDGDDADLKRIFLKQIKDDIFNNTNHKLVSKTIEQLELMGYEAQVNPREINCFYLKDNIRERIEFFESAAGQKGYTVLNTNIVFSKEELLKEIDLHPGRFSPNVVLRPLYQQCILPNLAYVGGPGELAYWLEYKTMFDHHKINFPVLIPRNFALLTDEKTNSQIQKLGLTTEDFLKHTDEIIKEFITKQSGAKLSLKAEEEKLVTIYNSLSAKASDVDASLKASVDAELQKVLNGLTNIESKLIKAEKQKQEVSINQIKKIKSKFFPNDVLQERYDNFIPYYLKSGSQFIDNLKGEFDPFEKKFLVIEF